MCPLGYQSLHAAECAIHRVNKQLGQYAGTKYNGCVTAAYHYSPVMATWQGSNNVTLDESAGTGLTAPHKRR